MTDRFMTCLPFTLAQEGRPGTKPGDWINPDGTLNEACWRNHRNFSNDAHDPGGETMCGIIQREYSVFRKSLGRNSQDVINISTGEGMAIYHDNYWAPHCDDLPAGFDLSFFDASVNEGEHEATKILQVVIGAANDGVWGTETMQRLEAYRRVRSTVDLIHDFAARRRTVYHMMSGFAYFGNDWITRANEIQAASIAQV